MEKTVGVCSFCGDFDDRENYVVDGPSDIVTGDEISFFCNICTDNLYDCYRSFSSLDDKIWLSLVRKTIKDDNGLDFYNWSSAALRSGLITLPAKKSAIKIQRFFRRHLARKKDIQSLYLLKSRLLKSALLPILPPEIYIIIEGFI